MGTDSSVWDARYGNRQQYRRNSLFFRGVWALIDISWITKPGWKHPVMTQCWPSSLFVLHKIQFGLLSTLPPPFFNVDIVISWMGPFYFPCLLPPSTPFSRNGWISRTMKDVSRLESDYRGALMSCVELRRRVGFEIVCISNRASHLVYSVCSQPSILQLLLIVGCASGCSYCFVIIDIITIIITIIISKNQSLFFRS